MRIAHAIADLEPYLGGHLVPTMGALHAGHAALIRAAREHAGDEGHVVVSVFVNPAQFNERADFDTYPRHLDDDARACERLGVDCVFAPPVEEVYPAGEQQRPVTLPPLATEPGLEDRFRPGHFEGVYRVCRRLFEMVRPRRAYFGEKDWQQLQLVRALVVQEGLDRTLGLGIVPVPTVREADGLALSSRNTLLSTTERARSLSLCRALVEAGRHDDPELAERAGRDHLRTGGVEPEYFAIRDAETLAGPMPDRAARALVAARLGAVRLIDNAAWPGFALG